MNLLCVGDVVGESGLHFFEKKIGEIQRRYQIDFTLVNGENAHNHNGISPQDAQDLLVAGADVITTGNHAFRRRDMYEYYEENDCVLRPANYPKGVYGKGICVCELMHGQVAVINLMGTVYMDALDNPFSVIDSLLQDLNTPIVVVDFHAEATSEKAAMAHYLDGKVSAVVGTHTHVQTADERILPKGTAFITDLGMTGPIHSSLGISLEPVIHRFRTHLPAHFSVAKGPCALCGAVIVADDATGKALSIERIWVES